MGSHLQVLHNLGPDCNLLPALNVPVPAAGVLGIAVIYAASCPALQLQGAIADLGLELAHRQLLTLVLHLSVCGIGANPALRNAERELKPVQGFEQSLDLFSMLQLLLRRRLR